MYVQIKFLFSGDVFTMRQGLAHDLKVKIDRAEAMGEKDLSDLRLDIKVCVILKKRYL
jgi:hypothetical protein